MSLRYTDNEVNELKKYLKNDPSIFLSKERIKGILCDLISDKNAAVFFATVFEDCGVINQMRKSNFLRDRLVVSIHDNKHYDLEATKVAIDFWIKIIDEELLKQYGFAEIKYIAENKTERPERVYPIVYKLYDAAKTYEEYQKVASLFELIIEYGSSADYAEKCKKICLAMDACEKAKELLAVGNTQCRAQDWASSVNTYEGIIALLSPFSDYVESPGIISQAKELLQKSKLKLKKQKEDEALYSRATEILSKATTIDEFKDAETLFVELSGFSDAKEKSELCVKRIKEITIKQQYQAIIKQKENAIKEKEWQKRSQLLQNLIKTYEQCVLSEKAKAAVEEAKKLLAKCLAEIENQRIKARYVEAKERFEKAASMVKHDTRLSAFSKIVTEFNSDAKTDEFVELIRKCNKEIDGAKKEIAYDSAIKLMNTAAGVWDFEKASAAFSELSGFKEAAQKAAECTMAAKRCRYERAIAEINENKKFFRIFAVKRKKS